MSTILSDEAHIILECRLVAYVQSLQKLAGNPLVDLQVYKGHGDANLDNIPTYAQIFASRSDTQKYWAAGLEMMEVQMLVQTQGDDVQLPVHNRRVAAFRTIFDLRNFNDQLVDDVGVPGFKTAINTAPGFYLNGWGAMEPPIQDAFDADKAQRQALLRFRAVCGILVA